MIKHIDKPWGYEEIIEHNDKYVVKKLFMKQGEQCSYQYHKYKVETIIVLDGELTIRMQDGYYDFKPFDIVTIKSMQNHRMIGKTDCLYLECSTTELNDVVRIEDNYGRI